MMFNRNKEMENNSNIVENVEDSILNETMTARLLEVSYEDNFVIVEVKRDCNINKYIRESNMYVPEKIEDDIFSTTLLDSGIDNIKRKKIYIFRKGDSIFNVYSTEDTILINEKIKEELTGKVLDQTVIKINKTNGNFKITKIIPGNNFLNPSIKSFVSKNGTDKCLGLNKNDALISAMVLIKKIILVENIENIIDLNLICKYLNIEDNEKKVADTDDVIATLRKILLKTM